MAMSSKANKTNALGNVNARVSSTLLTPVIPENASLIGYLELSIPPIVCCWTIPLPPLAGDALTVSVYSGGGHIKGTMTGETLSS